ncbi:MAG: serine/threonine-protein phosphatase [Deltaproteobacteria bacterium]|nr:serine/threonine-protein phosphatase [Deltaproteobacteria bacterium]
MIETGESYGFPLTIAAISDVGRVRNNNEDSQGHAWLPDGSLFVIVADGMGGHEAGEVASGLAVQVVEDVVTRDPEDDPRKRLHDALLEANAAILDEGSRSGTRGMGTTAITAVLKGQQVYIAQIGDSRCYHIRRGQLAWRSLDHTRVQMLVDNGEITDEEARTHPEAGMLTRALGHDRMADGRPLEPDVIPEPLWLETQDALLLCSDGLHDLLEDWEISETVAGRTPDEAAGMLVEAACERGGHDNVTVTIITAGPRAGDYDPNYVPEAWQNPTTGQNSADYDTFDGYDEETEQGIPQAAAPQYLEQGAAAATPAAQTPTPITANTGVISPAALADAQPSEDGNSKMMIYIGVAVGGFVVLFLILAVVAVVLYVVMA